MTSLVALGADVEWPDRDAVETFRAGSVADNDRGTLRDLAEWFAGVQGDATPKPPRRIRVIRFGFGPDAPPPATGAADIRAVETSHGDVDAILELGTTIADDEIDRGADLLVVAVAHRAVAAEVLIAALTGAEPVKVLPRGAALPPDVWMARAEQVRDGRRRALPLRDSPAELLSAIDDPDIVAATAFLLRTAARRTPMLLDGLAAAAAALVAHNVQARAARWWRMADASGHPAQDAVLAVFGQQAVLGLGTGMDDGTAGLLAAQVARTAVLTAIPGEV